jgi:RHS repeat-associated protein
MNALMQYKALFLYILLLSMVLTTFAGTETFQYDANGNLVRDGSKCYQYNGANQLENATNCAGGIVAQYWYDYTGRKIQAYENATTIYYPFPGFESRVNGSRLENTTYIYVNGDLVARKDSNGSMHYYHGDQLGSTSVITDASGNLEEKTKYLPFGGLRSGGTKTKYLFNGKELSATGLYDYLARWYNPLTMHFIMPDDLIQNVYDPQMLNRYSYVRNNPVYTDPSGHCPQCIIGGLALSGAYFGGSIYGVAEYAWNKQTLNVLSNREAQTLSMQRAVESSQIAGMVLLETMPIEIPGPRAVTKNIDEAEGNVKVTTGAKDLSDFSVPKGVSPIEEGNIIEGEYLARNELIPNKKVFGVTTKNGESINVKPDSMTGGVTEIKTGGPKIYYTQQIRGEVALAQQSGKPLNLVVRPGTEFSKSLQREIAQGNVCVKPELNYWRGNR